MSKYEVIIRIYKITNKINDKQYVGQTKKSLKTRFLQHANSKSYLGRSIRKYGRDNFDIECLCSCLSKNEADKMEEYFIKKYKSYGEGGYNLTETGRGTFNQNNIAYEYRINQNFDYSNFTTTEQGYMFDLIRKIDRFGRIKYGKNGNQYCRKWQDLSKVLNVSYSTIRRSLIPKIKKYNIIQIKNNSFYINFDIVKMVEKTSINYVLIDKNENTATLLDLSTNLIYKLRFE